MYCLSSWILQRRCCDSKLKNSPDDQLFKTETELKLSYSFDKKVIGRLELGNVKTAGTALHHWNEVLNSPRRQIAEWHKLKDWNAFRYHYLEPTMSIFKASTAHHRVYVWVALFSLIGPPSSYVTKVFKCFSFLCRLFGNIFQTEASEHFQFGCYWKQKYRGPFN